MLGGMIFWRLSLPVLKRTLRLERLVGFMAAPTEKERDPGLEEFSVRVAARMWRGSQGTCLERSLALHRALGRAGANPTLVCGMARERDGLVGHAWVEVDQEPLIDSGAPRDRYTVVARYSAAGIRVV